jgi:UrcA family protein
MNPIDRQFLTCAIRATLATLVIATAGAASAQQSDSRDMEETTVKMKSNAGHQAAPRIRGAGVGHRSATVVYSDLNLDNPAGIHSLYVRLESASQEVCSPRQTYRNPAMRRDWQACYEHAMDEAVKQVGHLGLQGYHLAKTGRDESTVEQVAGR